MDVEANRFVLFLSGATYAFKEGNYIPGLTERNTVFWTASF